MYISQLPIRTIKVEKPLEVQLQGRMVKSVRRLLELFNRTPATPQEQEQLAREIAATDHAIDALVYQLYGLTEDEIKIVESSNV